MKLIVTESDMKDEEKGMNKLSHISLYHFKPDVQIIIRALGRASYVENGDELKYIFAD